MLLNHNCLFFTKSTTTYKQSYTQEQKIREQIATIHKVTKDATKSKEAAIKFLQASGIKKIAAGTK